MICKICHLPIDITARGWGLVKNPWTDAPQTVHGECNEITRKVEL